MNSNHNFKAVKRLAFIIAMFAFLLVSCSQQQTSSNGQATGPIVDEIIKRGEINVGYLVWEPCVARDSRTGELSGIYVDMVNQLAGDLKLKVKWHETTLANFAAGLNSRQYDFSVGATFITIPRAVAVSFTQPVAYVGNSGIVKAGGSYSPTKIEDLNKSGVKIAVLQGQAMEEYCQRHAPLAELVVISGGDLTAPLAAVSSGRADIGLMNSVTVARYAQEHPEVTQVLTGKNQVQMLPLSWSTRPQDPDLYNLLNAAITYFKSTGRLAEYQAKYKIKLVYDNPALHELE